ISDHFTHSSMKCYDDRQFCNGHRTVTQGTPMAYLIQGAYSQEPNLQMVVEGRSEVGGNYLCGVATNEGDTAVELRPLQGAGLCHGAPPETASQLPRRGRHEDLPGSHLSH